MKATPSNPLDAGLPAAREPEAVYVPRSAGPRGPTVETILYLVILALAVTTRFALLDSQAMHHDEGIHALYGWNIYRGSGYTHDAVYHGPFIYHAGALVFSLFGDSDSTARLAEVLFSVGTVMLPVLLRRYLGRWGALLASALLLISPTFLYFGRFARNDVFGGFWALLLFVCVVRYLGEQRNGWLYGAAAAASLYFCTKETSYIALAIFLLFLGARLLWLRYGLHTFWLLLAFVPLTIETLCRTLHAGAFPLPAVPFLGKVSLSWFSLFPLSLGVVAFLMMLAWHLWETRLSRERNAVLDLVVVLGTMVLPLLSAIPLNVLVRLWKLPPIDYHSPNIPTEVVWTAVLAIGFTFALAAGIGPLWDVRRWALAAGIFWGPFVLLHTSFTSSMTGLVTGLVQALGFWLTQQEVKRIHVGPQYYLILMSVYETVSLVFGAIAAAYFGYRGLARNGADARRPTQEPSLSSLPMATGPGVATGLLSFWALTGFAAYTFAGEQVPWLNIHPTLPFVLLAGTLMGRIVVYRPRRPSSTIRRRWADLSLLILAVALLLWAGRPFYASILGGTPGSEEWASAAAWLVSTAILAGLAYLAFFGGEERFQEAPFLALGAVTLVMAALGASRTSFAQRYEDWWLTVYVPLALFIAAWVVRAIFLGRRALRAGALVVFAFLSTYSLASACRVAYVNNDTPVEMLVYVQTSSDLQRTVDELAALSTLVTGGKEIRFLYDTEVAWPLEWYVRNYSGRSSQAKIAGPVPREAAVALVYRDFENTSRPFLEGQYEATRFYAFNWWFPEETYRNARTLVEKLAPEVLQEAEEVNLGHVIQALARPSGQARVWRYLLFRELLAPIGAREYAVYVRRDLVFPLELLKDSIPRR